MRFLLLSFDQNALSWSIERKAAVLGEFHFLQFLNVLSGVFTLRLEKLGNFVKIKTKVRNVLVILLDVILFILTLFFDFVHLFLFLAALEDPLEFHYFFLEF